MNSMDFDDPYFRDDPGEGLQRIVIYSFNLDKEFHLWKSWRTNDGRVLPNSKSGFSLINDPFELGDLILFTAYFDPALPGKAFGGFGMRAPLNPPVALNSQTYIEFDLFFPENGTGKFMRFEIWSTTTSGEGSQAGAGAPGVNRSQVYIRDILHDGIGSLDQRCGFFNGKTWYKKPVSVLVPVSTGCWEYLNIDLHTETGTKIDGEQLMIGNIRITQTDPAGVPIPDVINTKKYYEVEPFKNKYNPSKGSFLIGVSWLEKILPDSIRKYHYEIFTNLNGLKPECHLKAPKWLKEQYPDFTFRPADDLPEWRINTGDHLDVINLGNRSEFKLHGHCLAWINQSPPWMRQVIPEHITSMQWNADGRFYTGGNNSAGPFIKIDKNTARRVYFNHIMYILRHFMSADPRYDSSEERGIIPFHSFDVVNVEIHESRHNSIIKENLHEWNTSLVHVSWLMAMTDDDFGDIRQHYVYLLFKYAHIAVPNKLMAEKYKAHYNDPDIVPGYMKADSHDNGGSIDAYVNEKPPVLVYNDYDYSIGSKARIAYNMTREFNTVWKDDPLYDGRNLIECIGIQGHERVSRDLIARSLNYMDLFTGLIDDGLLDSICFSEIDIRQAESAPGGDARAPEVLNQKQADAVGYQYALLFKMFNKYKKYIDHVTVWDEFGSSWMNSYVPFDHEKMASQAYYAIMDPDRFIKGHSYLDSYFAGEYEKLAE